MAGDVQQSIFLLIEPIDNNIWLFYQNIQMDEKETYLTDKRL